MVLLAFEKYVENVNMVMVITNAINFQADHDVTLLMTVYLSVNQTLTVSTLLNPYATLLVVALLNNKFNWYY
jgi:hypothetical protein